MPAETSEQAYDEAIARHERAAQAYRAAEKSLREAQDAVDAAESKLRAAGLALTRHEIYPGLPLWRHRSTCLSRKHDGHDSCRPEWHTDHDMQETT